MKNFQNLSIRSKLLFLLVSLPMATLVAYLILAIKLFKEDKIAYVFDSSAAVTNTLATQVGAELNSFVDQVNPVMQGYHAEKDIKFEKGSRDLFRGNSSLNSVTVFVGSSAGHKELTETASLQKTDKECLYVGRQGSAISTENDCRFQNAETADWEKLSDVRFELHQSYLKDLLAESADGEVSIRGWESIHDDWIAVAIRQGEPGKADFKVVVAVYKSKNLLKVFKKSSIYSTFLVRKSGNILIGPDKNKFISFADWKFFREMTGNRVPTGTSETLDPDNVASLSSFAEVGAGNLYVVSLVKRETALNAVSVLLWKSILFFIMLISFAVITSVFASRKLTAKLQELFIATRSIAEGRFDVNVAIESGDEVGSLAASFNKMGAEVSRLMNETAAKARMEKELETARTVQETLFPPSQFQCEGLEISGFYMPASECGGDWWNYCEIGGKIFLWIGDATGHGAPAALITSAARSAAAVIESMPHITPSTALELLNHAVFETSKGSMLMTFFLASIDKTTGELAYCNASHDPPFLIHKSKDSLTRSDIIPLQDVNNPRLGEKSDTKYKQTTLQLAPGDTLLFYTDGVVDQNSPDGQSWGERRFIKTIIESLESSPKDSHEVVDLIRKKGEDFRQGAALRDDVTFFICTYTGSGALVVGHKKGDAA